MVLITVFDQGILCRVFPMGGFMDGILETLFAIQDGRPYVEAEDSPRPLAWRLALLARTGFQCVDVLHKNACFAAFGATK